MSFDILGLDRDARIATVYVAFYGRAPDPDGFAFWLDEFESKAAAGRSEAELLNAIVDSFRPQPETQAVYPFLSGAQAEPEAIGGFVDDLYANLFNRTPDAEGRAHWTGVIQDRLASGQPVGDVIIEIVSGARNSEAGQDITTLENKIAAARFYAAAFDGTTTWSPESDASGARAVIASVGADAASLESAKAEAAELALQATTASVQAPPTHDGAMQFLLELINKARLEPAEEAARLGIDLNEGLPAGTLDASPKQPLAPDDILAEAARGHSAWMLDTDTFSHGGAGGSSVRDRIEAAGYTLEPPWTVGENIGWRGTTAPIGGMQGPDTVQAHHDGLFLSEGHRTNILNDAFKEVGLAQLFGTFTSSGTDFNASMLTQNFAASGDAALLTGVAFVDGDGDGAYDPGEGRGGVRVDFAGHATVSGASGGYVLAVDPDASGPLSIRGPEVDPITYDLAMAGDNAKVDVIIRPDSPDIAFHRDDGAYDPVDVVGSPASVASAQAIEPA